MRPERFCRCRGTARSGPVAVGCRPLVKGATKKPKPTCSLNGAQVGLVCGLLRRRAGARLQLAKAAFMSVKIAFAASSSA